MRFARRWWRKLWRWAVLALLVLLAGYASLPWWAPREYLRRQIAARLSAQTGLPVSIETLKLSWASGVQIGRLTIGAPSGFDDAGDMLSIDRLSSDFSPLTYLLTGRSSNLQAEGVRLVVQADEEGRWNVSALRGLAEGPSPENVHIHQAVATIRLRGQADRPIRLAIGELTIASAAHGRLGQVTMSAAVEQEGSSAPIEFSLSPGSSEQVVAVASLRFSSLRLQDLPLVQFLPFPLRKCGGVGSGWAEIEVDRDGTVSRVGGNVSVVGLDMQPAEGPQLPVLENAGLGVDASFDPITGQVSIHQLQVRLPGAGLTGSAELSAAAATGNWEAIRSLRLEGNVRPSTLAALLTADPSAPLGVEMNGPVAVSLTGKYDGVRLEIDFAAQAEAVAITRGGRVLKPAGRELTARLTGSLDRRNWRLGVQRGELVLGGNRFSGSGVLDDVRALVEATDIEDRQARVAAILKQFAAMNWNGDWELGDLPAMGDALAWTNEGAALSSSAAVTGRWFIDHSSQPRVHLIMDSPADAGLTVGEWFRQPAHAAVRVDLAATIDPSTCTLRELDGDIVIGEGRLSVDRGTLALADPNCRAGARLSGQFDITDLQPLASAAALDRWDMAIAGPAKGSFEATADGTVTSASIVVRLDQCDLRVGRYFHKTAGAGCALELAFARDDAWAPPSRNELTVKALLPAFDLTAHATIADDPQPSGRVTAELLIADAHALVSSSPVLAETLGASRLAGRGSLAASADWQGRRATGKLHLDAGAIEFASAGPDKRVKAAGAPLTLDLAGNVEGAEDGLAIAVDSGAVTLGATAIELQGRADLPAAGAGNYRVSFGGSVAVDDPLCGLLPELARRVRQWGVTGSAGVSGAAQGDGKSVLLTARIDASAAGLAAVPFEVPLRDAVGNRKQFTLTKPPGLPAELSFSVAAKAADRRVMIDDIDAKLAGVSLRGMVEMQLGPSDHTAPELIRAKLAVGADAGSLPALVPQLADYSPSGGLTLQGDWTGPLQGGVLSEAHVGLRGFRSRLRGRDLDLNGAVTIESVSVAEGRWSVGRLVTNGLEVRAASSHGWVLADLTDLSGRISGEFAILAEQIDDKELADWLSGPTERPPVPADPSARAADREKLLARADGVIDAVRPYLAEASVQGRIVIDRYRSYDPTVDRYYLIRHFMADLSDRGAELAVVSGAGVNGGILESRWHADLSSPSPRAVMSTEMRDILASEDIQPQLSKYFPGNTVYGLFSRSEELTVPLRELVARTMDPTFAVHASGRAKTVTVDGLLEGRAAPSFVARIFPGLNLTKYRYNKMTGFAEYQGDGTAVNDMVFSGQRYDIYIEGTTDADNIGRYGIGLILLGTPQSAEWNHTYRQGRIPLLKVKARIEGGKMHDETVSFVYPNESLFAIFLKNNIFYRLWVARPK